VLAGVAEPLRALLAEVERARADRTTPLDPYEQLVAAGVRVMDGLG
jgi:hypothetical protein